MGFNLKDIVGNIFHTDEKEKATEQKKAADLQQKVNNTFGTGDTYNPFLKKNGELFNPNLNYQQLLDNPNISQRAKNYISQATGLTQTTKPKTENMVKSSGTSNNKYKRQSFNDNNKGIGFISSKYESGGDGGAVSSGKGDAGGVSYGVSQFSSTKGSADKFVSWLKNTNPDMASEFKNYKAGTTEFSNAWKNTFSKYGDSFTNVQKQYTFDNYVKPLADLAKQNLGIDYTRSTALKELLYSTAIQFGSGSLGLSALGNATLGMSDEEIVNASYDKKISNYKNYFKSSSSAVQESVKNRFINERKDVLQLLG